MKYLLDTHVWLSAILAHPKLSARSRAVLGTHGEQADLTLSAISLKEAAWLLVRNPSRSPMRNHGVHG